LHNKRCAITRNAFGELGDLGVYFMVFNPEIDDFGTLQNDITPKWMISKWDLPKWMVQKGDPPKRGLPKWHDFRRYPSKSPILRPLNYSLHYIISLLCSSSVVVCKQHAMHVHAYP
jgi:hypothetical protein